MDVVIVGAGIGGLSAALGFARSGHRVEVIERDEVPLFSDAEEAFAAARRGAPQVHQTHGFLARIQVLLRDRFPDVLESLLGTGCRTLPMTNELGEPQPGDEDLQVLIVRRTTLEWILREAVLAEPDVSFRVGGDVDGLLVGPDRGPDGQPVVTGVRLGDGTTVETDLVVAATGRRGPVPEWLAEIGVEIDERQVDSGLMYLSRWYRMPGATTMELEPKLGGDLGFVKYLGIPGDGDTLSITLAIPSDDRELRGALSDAERFEHACRVLPGPDTFFGKGPLEALGSVRPMTRLLNRTRTFTDDDGGRPLALGFHAVGDAHTCTNPLYGRGCSLAMAQALHLVDAVTRHGEDLLAVGTRFEAESARDIVPWYEVSVQMDRMGADPAGFAGAGSSEDGAGKAMAAVFAAAQTDPVLGRGLARFWNLLSTPADMMADAEFLGRMAEVMADPDKYPTPPREGPTRDELLATLVTDADREETSV